MPQQGPGAGGQQTVQAAPYGGGEAWQGENPYVIAGTNAPFYTGEGPAMPRPGEDLEDSFFSYADPTAFQNPNADDIYGVINYGLNQMSQQAAPQLGQAALAQGAQMSPAQMLYGAQIAPQMLVDSATLNTAQDLQYTAAQNQLANELYAASQGLGPSVAEQQARMQAEAATQAQMGALAASGGSPLGARAAMLDASRNRQAAAQTGALGRSQEAMSAQQALSALLGGARGQSQTTAQTQAQLQQQALLASQGAFNTAGLQQAALNQQAGLSNQQIAMQQAQANAEMQQQALMGNQAAQNQFALAQQQAQLQQTGMNNELYNQMLAAYMQENQQDITNAVAYQQLLGQEQTAMMQINAGMESGSQGITSGLASAGMAAGGAMLAMSDRRAKTRVRSARASLHAFLEAFGEVA